MAKTDPEEGGHDYRCRRWMLQRDDEGGQKNFNGDDCDVDDVLCDEDVTEADGSHEVETDSVGIRAESVVELGEEAEEDVGEGDGEHEGSCLRQVACATGEDEDEEERGDEGDKGRAATEEISNLFFEASGDSGRQAEEAPTEAGFGDGGCGGAGSGFAEVFSVELSAQAVGVEG